MQINPAIPGKLTRIADGNVGAPRLSADGSTVVYNKWVNDQWDVLRWKDGNTEVVSDDPHHDLDPSVSGDGDTVVFSRYSLLDGTDQTGNFDVLKWQNGATTTLGATQADEFEPAISADGKTVVWTYDDPRKPIGYDLQRSREGQVETLTTDWPVDFEPKVSADGSRVIFRRKVKLDDGDLWVRDEDGSSRQLTHSPWAEWNTAMDASASTLVYSYADSGRHRLYRLDVDSGQQTLAVAEQGVDHMEPTLSADGTRMAWTRQDQRPGKPHEPQILLQESGETKPFTVEGFNEWPRMSADGKVLTWLSLEDDGSGTGQLTSVIYRFDREDSPPPPARF